VHKTEDGTFRESDWNETSSTEHQEYAYSKVAAEREAWKMADAQDRWKLITICPALVVGPSLTASSSSGSLGLMQEIMGGHVFFGVPDLYFGIVDVREVATAHVKAAELPAARGRYIVSSSNSYSFVDCARAIRAFHKHPWLVPTWTVPNVVFWLVGPLFGVTRRFVKANVGTPFRLDNSRSIQELGLSYRPLEESLLNHYHQWLDDKKAK
jgi:nucleoside-diphosphate-sugar epimerase